MFKIKIWVFFRVFQKSFDEHTYRFYIRSPSPQDENVDEDNESPPEQGKSTLISAKSFSGLVRSKEVRARPKTTELLHNVRRKSCSKKDSVGAQNTQPLLLLKEYKGKIKNIAKCVNICQHIITI